MGLTSDNVDRAVPCFDPDCLGTAGDRSVAEPEHDGDHTFYACTTCGSEFGYRRIRPATTSTGTCAAGIPLAEAGPQPPLLQIGRRNAPAP